MRSRRARAAGLRGERSMLSYCYAEQKCSVVYSECLLCYFFVVHVAVFTSCALTCLHSSPIAGAPERITALRHRNQEVSESIAELEDKVAQQAAQLERMNPSIYSSDYATLDHTEHEPAAQVTD